MTRRSKRLLFTNIATKAFLMLAGLLLTPHNVEEPSQPTPPKATPVPIKKPKGYRQLGNFRDQVSSLDWSPDGRYIAASTGEGRVRIWSAAGHQIAVFHTKRNSPVVAWRPDSRILALSAGETIRHYSASTWRESRSLPSIRAATWGALAWSSDGRWLAADTDETELRVWNVATGRLARRIRFRSLAKPIDPLEGCITDGGRPALAWRPGTTQIAYVGPDNRFRIWDALSGKLLRRRRAATFETSGVDWSPDGSQLVVGSFDGAVGVWDGDTGKRRRLLRPEVDGCTVYLVEWCRKQPWVAVVGSEKRWAPIRILDARTGKRVTSLWGHNWAVDALAWSPDGKVLASAGLCEAGIWLWDVAKRP